MQKPINFTEVNPLTKKENSNIRKEISLLIKKKDFILGKEVSDFENQFSRLSKYKYAVSCGSGTDALILSLMALDLQKDDEIIVPGLTYVSTAYSVLLNKNKLVLADIDKNTGLVSIKKIKEKITKKTKAIIPVELYGQKINLPKLKNKIGKRIHIVKDCAQSHFAFINKKINTKENYLDIACYSFYPAKNLGAYGDGGLICTNNTKIYLKLLKLRNLGSIKKHKHIILGKNSRLDTIQAIVLKNKLKSIFKLNERRRRIAQIYDKNLEEINQITLTRTNPGSSRHLYVIRTRQRDKLIKYLSKKKIFCQIHYPYSLNKLAPVKKEIKKTVLKNSEKWAKECLSLPIHPYLSKNEVKKVVYQIKNFFNYHK